MQYMKALTPDIPAVCHFCLVVTDGLLPIKIADAGPLLSDIEGRGCKECHDAWYVYKKWPYRRRDERLANLLAQLKLFPSSELGAIGIILATPERWQQLEALPQLLKQVSIVLARLEDGELVPRSEPEKLAESMMNHVLLINLLTGAFLRAGGKR